MTVLFLAPQPFYRLRGMCIAQKQYLEALSEGGHEVDVLTFPFGADLRLEGVRILRLPRLPGIRDIPIGPSWQKAVLGCVMFGVAAVMCATRRYDVVHACEEAAFWAAILRKMPFGFWLVYDMDDVISLRVDRSGFLRSRLLLALLRRVERWAIRTADAVVTNSLDTTGYAQAQRRDGVIFYDHLPIIEIFDALPETPPPGVGARSQAGTKTILYAGNLESYQGIELLLKSLPEVFARVRARCVIIGGEDAQIKRHQEIAARLGLHGQVEWLGKKSLDETFGIIRSADVLVSPMTQEKAVPMKLYFYMASGVPIVATMIASHEQLLTPETALLVAPEPSRLAAGLIRILGDAGSGEGLSRNAYALFQKIYAENRVGRFIELAYQPRSPSR
jgi:glycosyltransferase involved in cell wall biosynthesis